MRGFLESSKFHETGDETKAVRATKKRINGELCDG
jgi:hypothetical protein